MPVNVPSLDTSPGQAGVKRVSATATASGSGTCSTYQIAITTADADLHRGNLESMGTLFPIAAGIAELDRQLNELKNREIRK